MGIQERKIREKEQKKDSIIKAAEKLLVHKGPENFSMDAVAANAEMSKGALYLHFKNKTDLLLTIVQKAASILNRDISAILSRDIRGLEMIKKMGYAYLSFINAHPEFYSAIRFYEDLPTSDELKCSEAAKNCQECLQRNFTSIVRAIQIGIQDCSIKSELEPKELALIIMACTKGMVMAAYHEKNHHYLCFLEQQQLSVSSLFDRYIDLIIRGISSPDFDH